MRRGEVREADADLPTRLWWSPTLGLITVEDGVWWRIPANLVSLRHDGFPNELPGDARELVIEQEQGPGMASIHGEETPDG